jgi:trimeric autotransporter adhesin
MRTSSGRTLLGAVTALGLLGGVLGYTLVPSAPAAAAGGALPGGTGISVRIDSPADGAVLPPGPVTLTGTASVAKGVGVPNTALIFVLALPARANNDAGPFGGACPGTNTILDCEKTYVRTLNRAAVDGGAVPAVGIAGYAAAGRLADVGPAAGQQLITGPATDADGADGRDVTQVGLSAFANEPADTVVVSGFGLFDPRSMLLGTAVDAGIRSAVQLAQAAGRPNTIVAFLSDGFVPQPEAVAAALDEVPPGVHFYPYSIGATAKCAGSLRLMADRTGGKCGTPKNRFGGGNHTIFGEDGLGDLPDLLRDLLLSRLTGLTVSVDGGPAQAISTPSLPARGPVSVTYSTTLTNLTPGRHELCVTAAGHDSGGDGSVRDCRAVVVGAPPAGSVSLAGSVAPLVTSVGGSPLAVTFTVSNDGELAMPDVRLTTKFPAGLSVTGEVCQANTACDLGALKPGQRRTVLFTIPATTAVDDRALGTVTTTGPDVDTADNSAAVRLRILAPKS